MIAETKKRIYITIPKDREGDLERYAAALGMTKSSFLCMCAFERIAQYEKAFNMTLDTVEKATQDMGEFGDEIRGQMTIENFFQEMKSRGMIDASV